jgi:hypothetical protein
MTHRHLSAISGPRDATRWQGRQTIIDQEPRRRTGAQASVSIPDNKGTTT